MLLFLRFAAVRAVMAFLTLILVSFIVFTLMELVPGDCAERYLAFKNTQGQQITVEDIDALVFLSAVISNFRRRSIAFGRFIREFLRIPARVHDPETVAVAFSRMPSAESRSERLMVSGGDKVRTLPCDTLKLSPASKQA